MQRNALQIEDGGTDPPGQLLDSAQAEYRILKPTSDPEDLEEANEESNPEGSSSEQRKVARPHGLEVEQGELPLPMAQMQYLNPQSRFAPSMGMPASGDLDPGPQTTKNKRLIDELVFLKKEIQLLKQIHYNSDLAQ